MRRSHVAIAAQMGPDKTISSLTLEPGDCVALDLEMGSGDLGAWALVWLTTVQAALGFAPLVYTSPGFIAAHNLSAYAALGAYGLWIASWGTAAPVVPTPWTFYACWQTSATGSVPGVSGACDLDTFNGSLAEFLRYGLPAPMPVPTPPTPAPVPAKRPFDYSDLAETERILLGDATNGYTHDVEGAITYLQQLAPSQG